jgi:ABC-type Co2+ transport system permease subunit
MTEEFEKKLIKPIINASYPGTLAALSLAVLQVGGKSTPVTLRLVLLLGAMMFLLSAFFIFFYSIYPTRKKLWTGTAITFLLGLCCSILSVFLLFIT